ncbi:MAG: hypothetical protein RLY20_2931 [Verrucomicrobiota bacterium]|jgi:autotransporter-associated beta strand protein
MKTTILFLLPSSIAVRFAVLAALLTLFAATPTVNAAKYLWDADNVTAGAQDGSGTWQVGVGNWDTNTANWAGPSTYTNGNEVIFNDSASGSSPITVTLTDSWTPYSVTVDGTKDYVLTGSGVAGGSSVKLTKTGASTLTLANDNTYAGGTTISGDTAKEQMQEIA